MAFLSIHWSGWNKTWRHWTDALQRFAYGESFPAAQHDNSCVQVHELFFLVVNYPRIVSSLVHPSFFPMEQVGLIHL